MVRNAPGVDDTRSQRCRDGKRRTGRFPKDLSRNDPNPKKGGQKSKDEMQDLLTMSFLEALFFSGLHHRYYFGRKRKGNRRRTGGRVSFSTGDNVPRTAIRVCDSDRPSGRKYTAPGWEDCSGSEGPGEKPGIRGVDGGKGAERGLGSAYECADAPPTCTDRGTPRDGHASRPTGPDRLESRREVSRQTSPFPFDLVDEARIVLHEPFNERDERRPVQVLHEFGHRRRFRLRYVVRLQDLQ